MNPVKILVKIKEGFEDIPLPEYASEWSSGMDIRAAVDKEVNLDPGDISLVPTGLFMAVPDGYELQIRPRSGLALHHGISILNSPGTIDSDYRGEIGIIVANFGKKPFKIQRSDRIAQIVIQKVEKGQFVQSHELPETERGSGGFGHTGFAGGK
jgi:dUTP pyrophosphatase